MSDGLLSGFFFDWISHQGNPVVLEQTFLLVIVPEKLLENSLKKLIVWKVLRVQQSDVVVKIDDFYWYLLVKSFYCKFQLEFPHLLRVEFLDEFSVGGKVEQKVHQGLQVVLVGGIESQVDADRREGRKLPRLELVIEDFLPNRIFEVLEVEFFDPDLLVDANRPGRKGQEKHVFLMQFLKGLDQLIPNHHDGCQGELHLGQLE